MKWITIIYLLGICVYNLFGVEIIVKDIHDCIEISPLGMYWSFHYSFFVYLALSFTFYTLMRKSILKQDKLIFRTGMVFSLFYLFYQFLILFKGISAYFYMINSLFWGFISTIIIIVLFLIYLSYDEGE